MRYRYEIFLKGHKYIDEGIKIGFQSSEDLIQHTNGYVDERFIAMIQVRDLESGDVMTLQEFKEKNREQS